MLFRHESELTKWDETSVYNMFPVLAEQIERENIYTLSTVTSKKGIEELLLDTYQQRVLVLKSRNRCVHYVVTS